MSTVTKTAVSPASEDVLKALDLILVIDHSGSMDSASKRLSGKSRWDEVKEDTIRAANVAGRYDADGLTVIAFATGVRAQDGVTADKVEQLFQEVTPGGNTNLTAAIDTAIEKAKASSKEVVALVYTDGAPNDEKSVIEALNRAGKELGRPKIGFCFIQVGDDPGAAKFLNKLDNDLAVDVCATYSAADAESMKIEQLIEAARTL